MGAQVVEAAKSLITSPVFKYLLIFGLGYLARYLHDRRTKRHNQHEVSRSLVVPARNIVDELRHSHLKFENAMDGDREALASFFNLNRQLFQQKDHERLESETQNTSKLGLSCYDSWQKAIVTLSELRAKHDQLRGLISVPSEESELLQPLMSYRRLLNEALTQTRDAVQGTKPYGDRDTKRLISKVIGEQ